jgi:phage nucleotide-binding protein
MAIQIRSTKDVKFQGLFLLIHGRSGAGKTSLARTIPQEDHGKTLVISAEAGLLPLRNIAMDMVEINTFEEMTEVFKLLKGESKYNWCVIDSLTEVAEKCLIGESQKGGRQIKPGWDEYYWFTQRVEKMIKSFRDLRGVHVVMTALSSPDTEDEKGKLMPVIPARKLRSVLAQYFDEVLYLNVDRNGKRSFITDCSDIIEAKDRSGSLGNPELPDLSVIVSKILKAEPNGGTEFRSEAADMGGDSEEAKNGNGDIRMADAGQICELKNIAIASGMDENAWLKTLSSIIGRPVSVITELSYAEAVKIISLGVKVRNGKPKPKPQAQSEEKSDFEKAKGRAFAVAEELCIPDHVMHDQVCAMFDVKSRGEIQDAAQWHKYREAIEKRFNTWQEKIGPETGDMMDAMRAIEPPKKRHAVWQRFYEHMSAKRLVVWDINELHFQSWVDVLDNSIVEIEAEAEQEGEGDADKE